ncbi:hypothetical protein KY361_04905 [Candidatus Woesearchaeota archaeon]|nr:hypothetical protein [Candidatus Woesearchaeota archaeon]
MTAHLDRQADEERLREISSEFGLTTDLKGIEGIVSEVRMNRAKRKEYFNAPYRTKESERPRLPLSQAGYLDPISDGDILTLYESWKEYMQFFEQHGRRGPDVSTQRKEWDRFHSLWDTLRPYINRTRPFGLIQAVHKYLHERGLVEEAEPGISREAWERLMLDVTANHTRARENAARRIDRPPLGPGTNLPATGWHKGGPYGGWCYGNPDHQR